MVYTRRVGERTLNFAVSGKLWERSLVMIDVETKSLWSHLLGEAMSGPLEGEHLEALPAEMVTWQAWRKEHPQTTVLDLPRTSRDYVRDFYRRPHDFVFGWVEAGEPFAVGFDELMRSPVLNVKQSNAPLLVTFDSESTATHLFDRRIEKRELHFVTAAEGRMQDTETKTLWNRNTGVAVEGPLKGSRLKQRAGIVSYARAWKVFHPQSRSVRAEE